VTWQSQIGFPILSLITFLPLLGVIAMLLAGRGKPQVYKSSRSSSPWPPSRSPS